MPPITNSGSLGGGETGIGRRALGIEPIVPKAGKVVKPKPKAKAKAKAKTKGKK